MTLIKTILNLMLTRAGARRYRLEIGAYLLKKGCGYEVGQIIKQRQLRPGLHKVKVITGLYYDFAQNKINHTAENKILRDDEKTR